MRNLVLENLGCKFGNVTALAGIDLIVEEGELLSLLGPSGCGKTTTLQLIAGFLAPTQGRIVLNGIELSNITEVVPPERRGMSMIFQSYALWPNMTVSENVAFGLTFRGHSKNEIREKVKKILGVVRMEGLADRYPGELSGGQQQRVALARALVIEPKTLLVDEPLSNLDAQLRESMRSEIRRLHDEFGITTIYVTHDQAEAMAISDRIAVMNGGRIEQCGSPWALYNSPQTQFVARFVGRSNVLEGVRDGALFHIVGVGANLLEPNGGERILLAIRPECIVLSPLELGREGSVPGQVLRRIYLGDRWEYQVQAIGGAELRVVTLPVQQYAVGCPISLFIDPMTIAFL